jgi:hypothetical protein
MSRYSIDAVFDSESFTFNNKIDRKGWSLNDWFDYGVIGWDHRFCGYFIQLDLNFDDLAWHFVRMPSPYELQIALGVVFHVMPTWFKFKEGMLDRLIGERAESAAENGCPWSLSELSANDEKHLLGLRDPSYLTAWVKLLNERRFILARTKERLIELARENKKQATSQKISRQDVFKDLDWLISIEPDPETFESVEKYAQQMLPYESGISRANKAFASYALHFQPGTLAALQDEFYSITNCPRYSKDAISQSVARAYLTEAWHGIHGWQK